MRWERLSKDVGNPKAQPGERRMFDDVLTRKATFARAIEGHDRLVLGIDEDNEFAAGSEVNANLLSPNVAPIAG